MRAGAGHYTLPFLLIALFVVGGCADNALDAVETKSPAAGSWYAFRHYKKNASREEIRGTESFDTFRVVSTGNSYRGENNLHLFSTGDSNIYVGYQSNADVLYRPQAKCGCLDDWVPFVIGTQKTRHLRSVDTTYSTSVNFKWSIRQVMHHDAIETITVPAGTFETHKMTLTRTEVLSNVKGTATAIEYRTYYFAPSIGYLVKVVSRTEVTATINPSRVDIVGSEQVLTGYEVK